MKIKDLENREELLLVTDSQDVEAIKADLGADAQNYDGYFVDMVDGELTEVWGFEGTTPSIDKHVWQII